MKDEGLGKVIKVGDLKKMVKNLDDDYLAVFTARQRISLQEAVEDWGVPIPYQYVETEVQLEDISKEEKTVYFEMDLPSQFFYLDN